jgi:hypothetical protein
MGRRRSQARLRYPGAVIILKRDKITFHFVLGDAARAGNQPPPIAAGQIQRKLWFGANFFAEEFLRSLSSDRNADAGMSSLLTALGGQLRLNVPANAWIPELAPLLVSGKLAVTEIQAKKPGGEATKSKKGADAPLTVPRKAPVVEREEAPDASTFPSLNEDDQANALIAATQSGAALCEVCSKG